MPIKQLDQFNIFTSLPRIATSAFYKHLHEKGFNFRIYWTFILISVKYKRLGL